MTTKQDTTTAQQGTTTNNWGNRLRKAQLGITFAMADDTDGLKAQGKRHRVELRPAKTLEPEVEQSMRAKLLALFQQRQETKAQGKKGGKSTKK